MKEAAAAWSPRQAAGYEGVSWRLEWQEGGFRLIKMSYRPTSEDYSLVNKKARMGQLRVDSPKTEATALEATQHHHHNL